MNEKSLKNHFSIYKVIFKWISKFHTNTHDFNSNLISFFKFTYKHNIRLVAENAIESSNFINIPKKINQIGRIPKNLSRQNAKNDNYELYCILFKYHLLYKTQCRILCATM